MSFILQQKVEQAEKIHESLKKEGFVFDSEVLRELLAFAAQHKNDAAEAEKYLDLMYVSFLANSSLVTVREFTVLFAFVSVKHSFLTLHNTPTALFNWQDCTCGRIS